MNHACPNITIKVNERLCQVPEGSTVVAALALHANGVTRLSVQQEPRGALCGMGVCQECRVTVNGQRRLACQTLCQPGMVVCTLTQPSQESCP